MSLILPVFDTESLFAWFECDVLVLYDFIVVNAIHTKITTKGLSQKQKNAYQGLFPINSNSVIFQYYTPLNAYQVYVSSIHFRLCI